MKTRIIAIFVGLLISMTASAGYNNNIRGVIAAVYTYPSGYIIVVLKNQPASHPMCDHRYFEIDDTVSIEARNQMLSRALLAYAMKETVNIGYDDGIKSNSRCSSGNKIAIHRVG